MPLRTAAPPPPPVSELLVQAMRIAVGLAVLSTDALIEAVARTLGSEPDAAPELEAYYHVRLEPCRQRLVFDRWPRPGDQSFMLERPLFAHSGEPVTLRLLFDGTCLVVYANDEVALSTRLYDHRAGQWGLFVTEGEGHFRRVSLKVP